MNGPAPSAREGLPPSTYDALPAVWRACIELAWEALRAGSLPIGAVVADPEGRIAASGRNRLAESVEASPHLPGTPYLTGTPLAHAEVNALLAFGERRPGPRPVLYTTTEPCPLCMGAARMVGVGHVVYASRDPWAGCASMAQSTPYLVRQGPTAEGPVPELEAPLVALQTAVHLRRHGGDPAFLAVWDDVLPHGVQAGRALHRDGAVPALVERDASACEAWAVLVAAVEQARPTMAQHASDPEGAP